MQILLQQRPALSQMLPHPPIRYTSQIHDFRTPSAPSQFAVLASMRRQPPILQAEKQPVTTSAIQVASASRQQDETHILSHPRLWQEFHTKVRTQRCSLPYSRCSFADQTECGKGFARQHACKCDSYAPARQLPRDRNGSNAPRHPSHTLCLGRHQGAHHSGVQQYVCHGCRKAFNRLGAPNVSTWPIAVHLPVCRFPHY